MSATSDQRRTSWTAAELMRFVFPDPSSSAAMVIIADAIRLRDRHASQLCDDCRPAMEVVKPPYDGHKGT